MSCELEDSFSTGFGSWPIPPPEAFLVPWIFLLVPYDFPLRFWLRSVGLERKKSCTSKKFLVQLEPRRTLSDQSSIPPEMKAHRALQACSRPCTRAAFQAARISRRSIANPSSLSAQSYRPLDRRWQQRRNQSGAAAAV